MSAASLLRLLSLAAIWGGSFLFMRLCVPVLGPVWLILVRVLLAGIFLLGVGVITRRALQVKGFGRYYLVLGLFNSAIPFLLFAFAAQTLPASHLSILNSTAPIFGVIIGSVWTRSLPGWRVVCGMALGLGGVGVLVGLDAAHLNTQSLIALGAGLLASLCYAIASNYAQRSKRTPDPLSNAHGGMWMSVLLIAPLAPFFPPEAAHLMAVSPVVILSVLALGVVCSGVAYMVYFRLVADIGAAPALTVTFLVPVFGTLWGYLFLHEPVGWPTLIGGALILYGTALVVNFSPRALMRQKS